MAYVFKITTTKAEDLIKPLNILYYLITGEGMEGMVDKFRSIGMTKSCV